MNTIKQHIFRRFNTLSILFLLSSGSLFLLMLRLKFTESFYLLFLVWNLFLALIPFIISSYLSFQTPSKPKFIAFGAIWLLFLPNAPYIVTDLIHLQNSPSNLLWYDTIMILAFASTGLYLYVKSTVDIMRQVRDRLGERIMRWSGFFLPFLVGFGIYLGRFLRWNSWDILQDPTAVFYDVYQIIMNPMANKEAWIFIIVFGVILGLGTNFHARKLKANSEFEE